MYALSSRRAPAFLPAFSALMFFVGFEMGGFQFALSSISSAFSMRSTGAGLLVAAQYSSVILMPLLFGRISDRAGKRRVILVFSVVFLLGCLCSALSRGVFSFAAGVFLIGAGYSVCETSGSAALADLSPEYGARWVNISQGALSLGAVISPILTQYGVNAFGWSWRIVFLICLVGTLLSLVALFFVRYPKPQTTQKKAVASPRSFLRDIPFILFFCSILLYVGLENGFGYFAESLFSQELGAAAFGAYAISAYWASMAVSRLVFGVLSIRPSRALVASLCASGVLFFALVLLQASIPALVICAFIGFAFGPVWGSLMNLAAERFPGSSGGAMGLMSAGCGLGGALFPALMGILSDFVNLRAAFGLLALAAIAAATLSFFAARMQRS